jgi:hypothetical protein
MYFQEQRGLDVKDINGNKLKMNGVKVGKGHVKHFAGMRKDSMN